MAAQVTSGSGLVFAKGELWFIMASLRTSTSLSHRQLEYIYHTKTKKFDVFCQQTEKIVLARVSFFLKTGKV